MYLSNLKIENFRAFGSEAAGTSLDLTLSQGLNLLVGENDAGKTAVVDAIRHLLWTTSQDFHRLTEDDFHVEGDERAQDMKITARFEGLSLLQRAAFLEYLTIAEGAEPSLSISLLARRQDGAVGHKGRASVFFRAGADAKGPPIEGALREFLRCTYLKPLRDAEGELTAGKSSRLSQILKSHPDFAEQAKSDWSAEAPTISPTTLVGIMKQAEHLTRALVDKVDLRIAHLNGRRYTLQANKKKIDLSLKEDQILFSPEEAKEMFAQAGVLFEGQIKRDFEQLLSFNRAITEERQGYLEEERSEIEVELKAVGTELAALGKQRSEMLRALSDTDAFLRYKHMSANTVVLRADIATLERQRGHLQRLQELRHDIRTLSAETSALQEQVEQNVEAQNREPTSRFSQIRLYFNEVIEEVLDRKALLSVFPNTRGHLEFRAEILDEGGNATSADLGFTYRKLLCVAFDLAVLRVHLGDRFPRFAYHDGVLESLDDRKKENLLAVLRAYADLGLQSVITLIDSDLPARPDETPVFEDAEIVVRLHDMGEDGRLFRMASW